MFLARISLTVLLVTTIAAPVAAQTAGRNELTVFGGISLADIAGESQPGFGRLTRSQPDPPELSLVPFARTSTSLDSSGEFGVRYGRHLNDAVTVEGDFAIAPGHELTERVEFGCPIEVFCIAGSDDGPGARLFAPDRISTGRVVAYHYGGGIRLKRTWGSLTPSIVGGLGGVTYSTDAERNSQFAVRVGGAVTAAVGSLSTTIEVLDVIVPDHFVTKRAEHDVHIRIGLGVRW